MFRQRPGRPAPPSTASVEDWADGFCYWARQSYLCFGHDRREPVEWRPVVSIARRDGRLVVLPATTSPNPRFFHLAADQCLRTKPVQEKKDNYLSYAYETLPPAALQPGKMGVLPHPVRIELAEWLRRRLMGDAP